MRDYREIRDRGPGFAAHAGVAGWAAGLPGRRATEPGYMTTRADLSDGQAALLVVTCHSDNARSPGMLEYKAGDRGSNAGYWSRVLITFI